MKGLNSKLILYVAMLVVIFLRCIKFGSIPAGYHLDELGSAVDAWYIAYYGIDRYGISYPVYFINYGMGQSPMFTYFCAASIYLFGVNEIAVRLPMLFSAIMIIFFGVKLIELIWQDRLIKTVYAQILFVITYGISPYCFMASRFGLDCNLMFGAATVFLYFFISALISRNNIKFFISGIFAGIVLYSYAVSYVVMPLFLIMTLIYLIRLQKINLREVFCFAIPLIIIAIPLLLVQYINLFSEDLIMKLGPFSVTKMFVYRSGELTLSNIPQNVYLVFKSALAYDWIDYNTVKKFWNFYHVSIIFAVFGMIECIRQFFKDLHYKNFSGESIIFLWFLAMLMLGAMLGKHDEGNINPNANKINGIFISMVIFIVYGIAKSYSLLITAKLKKIFTVSMTLIYFVYSVLFFNYYFKHHQPKFIFGVTNEELIYLINEIHARPSVFTDHDKMISVFNKVSKNHGW